MSAGLSGTTSSTLSPPDVRTTNPGKARPNSSAVRRAPTTAARIRVSPHSGQRWSAAGRPQMLQLAGPAPPVRRNVPPHVEHRDGARHVWHTRLGRYPARGTCTSTGPDRSPSRAISKARCGSRAARAAGSRARSVSDSPAMCTAGAAARITLRSAISSCAKPDSINAAESTDRANPPTNAAHFCRNARSSNTSRACGYGARGSAYESSPSSHNATSPRSATGANAAARVPITTRADPRNAARKAR